MKPRKLFRIRERIVKSGVPLLDAEQLQRPQWPQRTHWIGCWREHHGCAVAAIEKLLRWRKGWLPLRATSKTIWFWSALFDASVILAALDDRPTNLVNRPKKHRKGKR